MANFVEIAKIQIAESKNVVISEREGGVSMAQQLMMDDNGITRAMFLKGALSVTADQAIQIGQAMIDAGNKIKSEF